MTLTTANDPTDLDLAGGEWRLDVDFGSQILFRDPLAKKGLGVRGGLSKVTLRRFKPNGAMRVYIQAFADLSAATLPQMTVRVRVGMDEVVRTATWSQVKSGWVFDHP